MDWPDLIIFDCDGVLVDSEVLSCRCLSDVLASYGIELGLDQALDLFLRLAAHAVKFVARGLSLLSFFLVPLQIGLQPAAFGFQLCLLALGLFEGSMLLLGLLLTAIELCS